MYEGELTNTINFKLSDEDLESLEKSRGIASRSAFLRHLIRKYAGGDI